MNEKQLDSLLKAVRNSEVSHTSIDHKFQRLLQEEHRKDKLVLFHIRPLTAMAFGIVLVVGLITTARFIGNAQLVAQNQLEEHAEMMEARNDMLSNTEHIYSVLFKSQ